MTLTAGIDVGSTYTKAVVLEGEGGIVGKAMIPTGFRLARAAEEALELALADAGAPRAAIEYLATTGYGRSQIPFRDVQATDLTAQGRGCRFLFPGTRTVLDVGGQTMKAIRVDERGKVLSFRLNDKCAAGTGAFLEKAAGYLGYELPEIGPLVETSRRPVPISGVCAVFAESEVINHVSNEESPADIMHGAMRSLVEKSVQLMRRVRMEPEFTLVGGILRFPAMVRILTEELGGEANVPAEDVVQYTGALGAAVLAHGRLERIRSEGNVPAGAP